jgi:hypothetical protein
VLRVNETTAGEQTRPAAARLADGSFVAVWEDRPPEAVAPRLVARLFDRAGIPLGGEFALAPEEAGEQLAPAVVAAGQGFLVAWQGRVAGRVAILARRFGAAGVPLGAERHLDTGADPLVTDPALAVSRHGFVVAWRGERPSSGRAFIRLRRLGPAGAPRGAELQAHPFPLRALGFAGAPPRPSVASDATGGFVVVWGNPRRQGAAEGAVFASAFDAAGRPFFLARRLDLRRRENPSLPVVVSDGDRLYTVVWQVDQGLPPVASAIQRGRRLLAPAAP